MPYYNDQQLVTTVGTFKEYANGYFTFKLENGDLIDFEQINKNVLAEFDLKSNSLKSKAFEITYKEILDDTDDEDFIVFKIDKLILL
ncbi:hypothetical protein C7447_102203 [Tenacibaculum adriaticum]|uniref:Uncharacterized protein n=1 Tax=Tenacibaculum adriaticum TaxID=413713 RepID=A0A5S5DSY5_9FLAO|nr:hypothetical protein [Tenacibaculum adriaticum]TYP98885.1 hypothetical protein C7447_102203 [Tenacibaculum adriaticum]